MFGLFTISEVHNVAQEVTSFRPRPYLYLFLLCMQIKCRLADFSAGVSGAEVLDRADGLMTSSSIRNKVILRDTEL